MASANEVRLLEVIRNGLMPDRGPLKDELCAAHGRLGSERTPLAGEKLPEDAQRPPKTPSAREVWPSLAGRIERKMAPLCALNRARTD